MLCYEVISRSLNISQSTIKWLWLHQAMEYFSSAGIRKLDKVDGNMGSGK